MPAIFRTGWWASLAIGIGRRLFRNTPVQRLDVVTRIYRSLFARTHPAGQDIAVSYLGLTFLVPADDITIVPSLVRGDYEREEFAALERAVRPGMIAVDIGANVGIHAAFFGSRVGPAGQVLALEPEPANHVRLVANVARNALVNVQPFNVAAGETAGSMRLYLAEHSIGTHSASPHAGATTIDVEVVRLDDFLRDRVSRVDVVKIDVEGFEPQVLAGFMETITRDRPTLLIEFAPSHLRGCGNRPEDLLQRLRALYPRILLFRNPGRPPEPLDAVEARRLADVQSGTWNLLCESDRAPK